MSVIRHLIAATTVLFLAAPANAQLNNPALLDVPGLSRHDSVFTAIGYRAEFSYEQLSGVGHPFVSGGISRRTTISAPAIQSWAWVNALIYEPDTVKRKSTKAKLGQKVNVAIGLRGFDFYGTGAFYFPPFVVPACKAKSTITTASGKVTVSCKNGAWAQLAIPQSVIDFYRSFLGLKKLKFTVKLP